METLTDLPKDMKMDLVLPKLGNISMEITDENEIFIYFSNDGMDEDVPDDQIPYFYEGYLKIPFTQENFSDLLDKVRTTFNIYLTKGEAESLRGIDIQKSLIMALRGQDIKVEGKDVDSLLEG
ncbi:MAG: hypothetical protein ABI721_05240 [Candidatus Dojkabacteria bacterium]